MRTSSTAPLDFDRAPGRFRDFLLRQARRLGGLLILAAVIFAVVALATWNTADPSLSHATGNMVTNAMGYAGAIFADLAMQFFGLTAIILLVAPVLWGAVLASGRRIGRMRLRLPAWIGSGLLAAAIAGCVSPPPSWPLPTGLGGAMGDLVLRLPGTPYPTGLNALIVALVLLAPAIWLTLFAAGALGRTAGAEDEALEPAFEDDDEEEEEDGAGSVMVGLAAHLWYALRAHLRRLGHLVAWLVQLVRALIAQMTAAPAREAESAVAGGRRIEPEFSSLRRPVADRDEPPFALDDEDEEDDDADMAFVAEPATLRRAPAGQDVAAPSDRVIARAPRPRPRAQPARPGPASDHGGFDLPPLELLREPKAVRRDASLSEDVLEQNARLLETVLEDFGVKGEIIQVRPGPVVTLYELEPAPGIKSSRVIGLADDIARSMSAIAARVAVVPGRNAIGIELPNATRETVYLRELLASEEYEKMKAKLGLALGKTINGEPVIADLAKMPHLLVAGTTGSGKSVAINTMILSLLYRMTPQQCRLIMIDPKMLELSVYDGIPHLLTPVVTDPKKAVVALKWTVREMEDRYRKMSKVGVRNIDGFNQRVRQALEKGEQITRTVQVGFDRDTGEAIYESESLDLEPMPHIVVIIDEMADLMMVAGKDIEGAIQRLAQMARAAGIHVIMATQRPSVDVITGTIKANFPTRISFQVTSKIDSRTILGEQGAEQLLGMGDMLYMAGGGRIQRVHGPFVSDEEVEEVVAHLKSQGVPEYLDAITADDGEDGDEGGGAAGGAGRLDQSDDPYDQAVAVVLRDGKVSTSYIQRRLGIGYNRAASIVERMEQEGIISAPNHAGKREILVPTEEDKM